MDHFRPPRILRQRPKLLMTIFIIAKQISKQSTSLNLEATSNLQKKILSSKPKYPQLTENEAHHKPKTKHSRPRWTSLLSADISESIERRRRYVRFPLYQKFLNVKNRCPVNMAEKTEKLTCMTFLCMIALRNKTVAHDFRPSFDNDNNRLVKKDCWDLEILLPW